jgi:Uma2 family endonuclease
MPTIAIPAPLTLEEFHTRYANSSRAYEYWFGEAVEKAMPTWLHSLVQAILTEMLRRAGYRAAPELELRIDPQFEPRPDISATRRPVQGRYPATPQEIEIVVEVLSPEDAMTRVFAKCGYYQGIGVSQVFVVDPETRTAWEWNSELGQLDRKTAWLLTNGQKIELSDVWSQLDTELSK